VVLNLGAPIITAEPLVNKAVFKPRSKIVLLAVVWPESAISSASIPIFEPLVSIISADILLVNDDL